MLSENVSLLITGELCTVGLTVKRKQFHGDFYVFRLDEGMSWAKTDLLAKAKLFANYAAEYDSNDLRYPLWLAVSLEMLARAVLSQVNPCLLADVRANSDDTGANLFYACGITIGSKPPISVAASTVFKRCRVIIASFTEAEVVWCIDFAGKRNEELHTGASPYYTYTPDRWLTDFYRISELLLVFLGLDLGYLFDPATVAVARKLVSDQSAHVKKQTLDALNTAKAFLAGLTPDEVAARAAATKVIAKNSYLADCPSGAHKCLISGEVVNSSAPRLDGDGDIIVSNTVIPTSLICAVCGLRLSGHAALLELGAGSPHTRHIVQDPLEFHGIDVMDHISDEEMERHLMSMHEPEYGND